MRNIAAVAWLAFKEGLGYRLLYGIIIMAVLVMTFAVLVSGFFMRDVAKVIIDFCLTAVNLGGLIIPFFLAVSMLAGDLERRTIFPILCQPISRRAYILGKFSGLALLTALVVLLLSGAGVVAILAGKMLYGARFFTSLNLASYAAAVAMDFLAILLLNSLVVLWCCLTTSALLATLLTLASYLIGQTIDDIVSFIETGNGGVPVNDALKYTVHFGQYLFPNLAAFDLNQLAAHGLTIPFSDIAFLLLYFLAYSAAALSLATVVFNRRDLT
jgi:ABC-type transport system involved in multi-copper enzyme maturation permease subunit